VAPWDPTALPAEVRPDLHRWLNQVVGHLNETCGWNPARTIPVCWAQHPHLVVLLAALAAQRQDAFADVRPEPAATWTFLTLPMFYRDLSADELETSCRRAGQLDRAASGRRPLRCLNARCVRVVARLVLLDTVQRQLLAALRVRVGGLAGGPPPNTKGLGAGCGQPRQEVRARHRLPPGGGGPAAGRLLLAGLDRLGWLLCRPGRVALLAWSHPVRAGVPASADRGLPRLGHRRQVDPAPGVLVGTGIVRPPLCGVLLADARTRRDRCDHGQALPRSAAARELGPGVLEQTAGLLEDPGLVQAAGVAPQHLALALRGGELLQPAEVFGGDADGFGAEYDGGAAAVPGQRGVARCVLVRVQHRDRVFHGAALGQVHGAGGTALHSVGLQVGPGDLPGHHIAWAQHHPAGAAGQVRPGQRHDLTVQADPDDLVRAGSNLLENALRHGRVPITLTARPRPAAGTGDGDGEMVDIAVRDHAAAAAGAGMALVGAARTPAERQTSSRRCGPAPQRVEATRAVLGCHLPTCAHRWQVSRATRTTTTASHKNFSAAADQYR